MARLHGLELELAGVQGIRQLDEFIATRRALLTNPSNAALHCFVRRRALFVCSAPRV